jgi:hypothetical protein
MLAHFGKEEVPQSVVSQDQPADFGRNGRYHPFARQLFHEPVQEIGLHSHYGGGEEGGLQVHSSLLNVVLHD